MGCPLVPVNNLQAIENYVTAGARELYMGFYDNAWTVEFGQFADINRMSGFKNEANAYSFEEIAGAIPYIGELGAKSYVTFNTASYNARMEPWFHSYFERLAQAGVTGVILSGPEPIQIAKEYGLQTVASTMCGIFNTQLANLYANWDMDRLILPRDLSLSELQAIIEANPQLEYEVFLMRNGCVFSDSHCLGMHGMGRGALCGEIRTGERKILTSPDEDETWRVNILHCDSFHYYACGLCAIWDLEQMGASAYKVVGRGDDPDAICEDIALVAENVAIAQQSLTREDYLRRMNPGPYYGSICERGLNCYYPEIWD